MKIKIVVLLVLSSFNLLGWYDNTTDLNNSIVLLPLFSILISVFFVLPRIIKGKLKIHLLFFVLLGLLYFNSPLYITSLINKNEAQEIMLRLNINVVSFIKVNFLLGISVPLIVAGFLTKYSEKINTMKNNIITSLNLRSFKTTPFVTITSFLLLLSIGVTGFTIGSTFDGIPTYYYILLQRFVIILATVFIYNLYINSFSSVNTYKSILNNNYAIFIVLLLFIVYTLIGGDRGPILVLILILTFGFLIINKMQIKVSTLLYSVVLLIFFSKLFTFIEVFRETDFEKLSISSIRQSLILFQEYDMNFARSAQVTALAIDGIENNLYSHTYGLFLIKSLVSGIPYFGSIINDNLLGLSGFNESASLLTNQHYGLFATSGMGTTYLADTYIEFGLIGIVVFSFLYGVLIGIFDRKCKENKFNNFSEFLLIAMFVGYSFYSGRAALSVFIVYFIHTWIIYKSFALFTFIFGYKLRKS